MFLDAIHYHMRSEGQVVKKAVYIAIEIHLDGRKDVLGMRVGENESGSFGICTQQSPPPRSRGYLHYLYR
jgi:transposase-like protein